MKSNRKKKLESEIGTFMKKYKRKVRSGMNSNDRNYDRELEMKIKKMDPQELDELLRGDEEDE